MLTSLAAPSRHLHVPAPAGSTDAAATKRQRRALEAGEEEAESSQGSANFGGEPVVRAAADQFAAWMQGMVCRSGCV